MKPTLRLTRLPSPPPNSPFAEMVDSMKALCKLDAVELSVRRTFSLRSRTGVETRKGIHHSFAGTKCYAESEKKQILFRSILSPSGASSDLTPV